MDESGRSGTSTLWRRVRITALIVVLLFLSMMALGFTVAKLRHGYGLTTTNVIEITLVALAMLGCGWLLVRQVRAPTGEDPLTRQERLNRNVSVASGVVGFALVVAMSLADGGKGAFSNDPLPPAAAILLILVTGVLVPAISLYWHRIIDEQEADATKTGALGALYVFAIGAPVWWLAWRGGFVPPPDGFIIYFATLTVVGAVWLWKKYF